MPRLQSAWERLALLVFTLFLATGAIAGVRRGVAALREAGRVAGESPADARRRLFGPAYAEAVDAIRGTIPRDGAYLLVNGEPADEGAPLWLRFDLAPRRCVFLGRLDDLGGAERVRLRAVRATRWVVVAWAPPRPPLVLERHEFLRRLEEGGVD